MSELAQMRIFARVVEAGSFSEAGRQIGAAPSSVSRQINEHEELLGVRLFNRTTRKLSVTEAGEIYYSRVRSILNEIEESKLAVSAYDGRPTGVLRVTVPSGMGRQLLAVALPDFLGEYPSIKVVLTMTDRQLDIVEAGIDVAIRVGSQPDSSLKARKIGSSRRLVCASPAYLKKHSAPKTPADLADHNCLTWRAHPGVNLWRFRHSKGNVDVRVSGNLFAQSADVLASAAVAGLGVILLPDWNIGLELRRGALTPILPGYHASPDTSPIYAVFSAATRRGAESARLYGIPVRAAGDGGVYGRKAAKPTQIALKSDTPQRQAP